MVVRWVAVGLVLGALTISTSCTGAPDCEVAIEYGPMGPGNGLKQRISPAPPPAPPSRSPSPWPRWKPARIKMHGRFLEAKLVKRVLPDYPKSACEEMATGTVHLAVTIGKKGAVRAARVAEGAPSFRHAAESAIKRWRYRPTLVNGTPVEIETDIQVRFAVSPRRTGPI